MLKAKVNVKVKEYKYFPHGFLNFDMPLFGVKEAGETIDTMI